MALVITSIGELDVDVDGSVEFNAFTSGYSSLVINGTVNILKNGDIVHKTNVSEMALIVKMTEISGYGHIDFTSLTVAYPYNTILSNTKYVHNGEFHFSLISLSPNLFFIYPNALGDITNE